MDGQTLLDSEMGQLLSTTQEISVIAPRVALALRPGIGEWRCPLLPAMLVSQCTANRCRFMTQNNCAWCTVQAIR